MIQTLSSDVRKDIWTDYLFHTYLYNNFIFTLTYHMQGSFIQVFSNKISFETSLLKIHTETCFRRTELLWFSSEIPVFVAARCSTLLASLAPYLSRRKLSAMGRRQNF